MFGTEIPASTRTVTPRRVADVPTVCRQPTTIILHTAAAAAPSNTDRSTDDTQLHHEAEQVEERPDEDSESEEDMEDDIWEHQRQLIFKKISLLEREIARPGILDEPNQPELLFAELEKIQSMAEELNNGLLNEDNEQPSPPESRLDDRMTRDEGNVAMQPEVCEVERVEEVEKKENTENDDNDAREQLRRVVFRRIKSFERELARPGIMDEPNQPTLLQQELNEIRRLVCDLNNGRVHEWQARQLRADVEVPGNKEVAIDDGQKNIQTERHRIRFPVPGLACVGTTVTTAASNCKQEAGGSDGRGAGGKGGRARSKERKSFERRQLVSNLPAHRGPSRSPSARPQQQQQPLLPPRRLEAVLPRHGQQGQQQGQHMDASQTAVVGAVRHRTTLKKLPRQSAPQHAQNYEYRRDGDGPGDRGGRDEGVRASSRQRSSSGRRLTANNVQFVPATNRLPSPAARQHTRPPWNPDVVPPRHMQHVGRHVVVRHRQPAANGPTMRRTSLERLPPRPVQQVQPLPPFRPPAQAPIWAPVVIQPRLPAAPVFPPNPVHLPVRAAIRPIVPAAVARVAPVANNAAAAAAADAAPQCRICFDGAQNEKLVAACRCRGSVKFVHESCLVRWIITSNRMQCELCRHTHKLRRVPTDLKEWVRRCSYFQQFLLLLSIIGLMVLAPVITKLCVRSVYELIVACRQPVVMSISQKLDLIWICGIGCTLQICLVGLIKEAWKYHTMAYRTWKRDNQHKLELVLPQQQ